MNGLRIRRTWRRGVARAATRLLPALALLPALVGGGALAAPKGAQVVSGSAQIVQKGELTTITAGNQSIIQYQSFNIAQGQTVQFIQPNSQSTVLNRILGLNPSIIAGTLLANGQVYFVNPAGIYFVNGCLVNVGALYAAAGYISNQNFLANVKQFTDLTGAVVNNGLIRGGEVALIGNQVSNFGAIVAPNGVVSLVSGTDVYLTDNDGQILVQLSGGVPAPTGVAVQNSGSIQAPGGKVSLTAGDLYALAIFNNGTIKANEITVQGQGPGVVQVSGTLDASNPSGVGGTINVLGDQIALTGATLNASGATGGGTILVGGDLHGANPAVPDASQTSVNSGSVISADALASGNGGKVVVWSNADTQFYGSITARGGAEAGNGGNVEVSGHYLDFQGTVDTLAPNGTAGTLLLDPTNLIIDNSSNQNVNPSSPFVPTGNPSVLTWATIATNLGLGNVVVTTAGSPATAGQNGDITIAAASPDLASANKLTISAVGTLYINFGITNNSGGAIEFSGASGIQLGANVTSTGPQTYDNPVTLTADVTLTASEVTFISTVDSDSASTPRALTLDGNAQFDESVGATYPLNSLNVMGNTVFPAAASLSITVNGGTANPEAFVYFGEAVTIGNGTSLTIAATGGTAPGADGVAYGYVEFGGPLTIGTGVTLNVTATGGTAPGADGVAYGYVEFDNTTTIGQGSTLTIAATGGTATGADGVVYGYVEFDNNTTVGEGSTLTITATGGTATGTDGVAYAYVEFDDPLTIESAVGTATKVNITATGGTAQDAYAYVEFDDTATIEDGATVNITATGGTATITGGTDLTANADAYVEFDGAVTIGNAASVTITAQGGTATVTGSAGTEASAEGYVEFDDLLTIGNPTSSTNTESSLTITANGGTATETGGSTGGFDDPPGWVEFDGPVTVALGATMNVTANGGANGYAEVYFDYDSGTALTIGNAATVNIAATGGFSDDGYVEFDGPVTLGTGVTMNVTATGGTDNEGFVEFYNGAVTFGSGSTVTITAIGGAENEAYVEFDSPLTIGNGAMVSITATGGGQGTGTFRRRRRGGVRWHCDHWEQRNAERYGNRGRGRNRICGVRRRPGDRQRHNGEHYGERRRRGDGDGGRRRGCGD